MAIRFVDESVGWIVGFVSRDAPGLSCQQAAPVSVSPCRGVILRTQDGGGTWQVTLAIPSDGVIGNPVRQLEAIDALHAWALVVVHPGCDGYGCSELRGTTDGGRTWTSRSASNIVAMRFASATQGWIATEDATGPVEVSASSDGGMTWSRRFRTASRSLVGLDAASTSLAWLMTRDPTSCTSSSCASYDLYRTDDSGTSWHELGNPKLGSGACTFGQLGAPLFASSDRGWLTLSSGAGGVRVTGGLLATGDGGRTWQCSTTPSNARLISAADPMHVWITANGDSSVSQLYVTEDGGNHWLRVNVSGLS